MEAIHEAAATAAAYQMVAAKAADLPPLVEEALSLGVEPLVLTDIDSITYPVGGTDSLAIAAGLLLDEGLPDEAIRAQVARIAGVVYATPYISPWLKEQIERARQKQPQV